MLLQLTSNYAVIFVLTIKPGIIGSIISVSVYSSMVLSSQAEEYRAYSEVGFLGASVATSLFAKMLLQHYQQVLYLEVHAKSKKNVPEAHRERHALHEESRPPQQFDDTASSSGKMFLSTCEPVKLEQVGQQEHWLIDPADVCVLPKWKLGEGGFGIIFTGSFHATPVAVKISKSAETCVTKGLPDLANEVRVLRHVQHPNIVLFHGACVNLQGAELLSSLS